MIARGDSSRYIQATAFVFVFNTDFLKHVGLWLLVNIFLVYPHCISCLRLLLSQKYQHSSSFFSYDFESLLRLEFFYRKILFPSCEQPQEAQEGVNEFQITITFHKDSKLITAQSLKNLSDELRIC